MKKNIYDKLFIDEFVFLERDYGFKLTFIESDNCGIIMEYMNSTTGVKIEYEVREAYITIMLYRLVDGKIIENTISATRENKSINGFSLDYIINLKNPDDLIRPAYTYGEDSEYYEKNKGIKNYIAKFVLNLKKYGGDVLKGDFLIFNELDGIVKNKIRTLK